MMVEELNMVLNDENPIKNATVTFVAFLIFGFIPLIPYVGG